MSDPVVIAGMARTPMGSFQGAFADVKATTLGAAAVQAAVDRSGVDPALVEQCLMGCVLPAGLGQAPARQAAIHAGLGAHVQATTVNKMCGSGMQAAIIAHDLLRAGSAQIIVAGGMESMTGAPYLLPRHRGGARIGHDRAMDSMFLDGLEDAYEGGKLMGAFAEEAARTWQLSREAQDAFAIQSLRRAQAAQASGAFAREIVPVSVEGRGGRALVSADEQPGKANVDKIPTLRPAFAADGTITPANASSISDGAAALVMMPASVAARAGLGRPCGLCASAGLVHLRARLRHPPAAGSDRLDGGRRRPVRSERGLCRRCAHRPAGAPHRGRSAECAWRRLRAGSPDWCLGRAYPRDAHCCLAGAWPAARCRQPVHWRRGSDGDGCGTGLTVSPPGRCPQASSPGASP